MRKSISILLVVAMLFSYMPGLDNLMYVYGEETVADSVYEKEKTTVENVYEKETDTENIDQKEVEEVIKKVEIQPLMEEKVEVDYQSVIDDGLEKLKDYYKDNSIDYIPAMAYHHSSNNLDQDMKIIEKKIRTYSLDEKNVYNNYKGIMEAIACGQDPRNFECDGKALNYVDTLIKMQKDSGEFDEEIVHHIYCMLALDMACGEYNVEKAVEILKSKFIVEGDQAYIKGKWSADLKQTVLAMIALSNHKDHAGVSDLLKGCINYIKSDQNDSGGFGKYSTDPETLGKVIQGLIAVGENPLAGDYVKKNGNMLHRLMEYQRDDGTYMKDKAFKGYDKNSTEAAFAALADLNKKKSMYHTLKIELGDTPSQIEIKADKTEIIKGKSTKLQAKVLDDKNRLVTGQQIKWISSDENIATVENGVVTAKEKGKVTITAELEGNSAVQKNIEIVVQDRNPSSIKIYLENKEVTDKVTIKKDEIIQLSAKIFDQDHEEMKEKKVTWSMAEGNTHASIDQEGKVTGLSKGNAVINAAYESIKASANIDVILMTDVVKDVLDEVQAIYKDKEKYTYLEALSLSYMGVDQKTIKEKLEIIDKPSYSTEEQDYAKNIIALISVGLDPRDYNGKNYVDELAKSQKDSGYFSIGNNSRRTENIVLPMIALDMADAKYNVNQCINILKTSAKSSKDTKYLETAGSYSEIEITSLAMIAMSKHKDVAGDLFNQCRGYLKEKQNDNAEFEAKSGSGYNTSYEGNCKATASVIQALIASGENPLKGDWVKNNKTIFDALISFKKENKFKETQSTYGTKDEATACAFAALIDLYKNKSMYHSMKIEIGTVPHKIEILGDQYFVKEGQTLKLRSKVTDIDGKLVPEQIIEWTSSDPTIAIIDEKGLVTGKDISQDQKIIIKAKIKDQSIEITKEIIVKARIPYEIKVDLPKNQKDNNLKEGKELVLFKKVLEKDGEGLNEDVIWSSSDENIAVVDEKGLVTAKEVQKDTKVTITVTSKSKNDVAGSIELNIIAIIPEKIEILFEDQEIDEKTIESGYKLKLDVKAYEKDKSLIENAEIEWTSSDQNVATIENGMITAKDIKEEKTIQITAKVKGFEAEKKLNLKVIPTQTNKQKSQRAIDDIKKYYEKNTKYGYLEAMALNRAGVTQDKIKNTLNVPKLTFTKGKWSDTEAGDYAKAIMSMIAAGIDPRDYEGKDCVKYLADSQVEQGYFDAKGYSYSNDKEADHIAYSMIALDMAGAEYNIDKALEALKDQFTVMKDQAYVKKGSAQAKLEKTSIALIAFSNHTDKEGIHDLVNKIKAYMKEQYNAWNDKTSSKDMANTLQAFIAIGEDPLSEDYIKIDQYKNKVTMLDMLLNLKTEDGFKNNKTSTYINEETTALAFAAITDVYKGKSMYKELKIKIGDPKKVEIQSENDQKELKVGKQLKLSAKALDKDGKFVPSQTFTWSISDPAIATIDANTGEVTAIGSGTVVITAMVKDFENIKNTFELKIVNVIPNKIEVSVDQDIKEIKAGKKIKINANVYDADNDFIENYPVEWTVTPNDVGSVDSYGIVTALKEGIIKITGTVKKADGKEIQGEVSLTIVQGKTNEEKINEAIHDVKEYFNKQDSYDFMTSLGLRFTDVNLSDISKKKNLTTSKSLGNYAKNVINIVSTNEDPKNYKGKNYIDLILNNTSKFYDDSNAGFIAKAIIALDMAGESYEEKEAITALIQKLTKDNDQYYIQSTYSSVEDTACALIALSNHRGKSGAQEAIEGMKKYLKEKQDENGFIEDTSNTAIVIQAIIAIGENPLSDEWTKIDAYGNKITLLDAILLCRDGGQFKLKPSASMSSKLVTSYALAALADLNKNKSMYHELKYVPAGKAKSIKINSENLNLMVGEEKYIEAQAFDEKNVVVKNAQINWESLTPTIVEVKDGKIKALQVGEGKVKVTLKENKDAFDEITVNVSENQDLSLQVKEAINKLVTFYDQHGSYDYMAALASKHIGEGFKVNQEKVASHLRLYRKDYAIHYAKNIMEIIAAGENPRNYALKDEKGNVLSKNYVMDLENSQKENGEFIVHQGADLDHPVTLSLSIMALDMADGKYNVEKAVNRLVNMIKDDKHQNDGLYTDVEVKALAITALSKHKDIAGVQATIEDCITYIKDKQNEEGGFDHSGYKNNPFAIGTVVQGLVANQIDPMKWVKNGNNMVKILLDRQLDNGGFEYSEQLPSTPNEEIFDDFKCTETAFAALADLYQNKSMYHSNGIKKDENDETSKKIKEEIEFLNKAYKEKVILDYLSALAGNLSGLDKQLIQSKLPENKRANIVWTISKQIMCLIGADLDPRGALIEKDEVRNFVYELTAAQVKEGANKGEFIITNTDKNSIEALCYAIIAMDMADGKYDKEAAVKRLLQMLKDKNSKTYREITTEALALTALSKHNDVEGVKETIQTLMDFLKFKQNEDGGFDTQSRTLGFKNSTIATGRVIQALIANGIDPISDKEWIKNDQTMLDALLKNKIVQENPERCGYGTSKEKKDLNNDATHQAFAALVDLYNHESMFKKLATQYNGPEFTSKERIDKLIRAVQSYYQTDYFKQTQGKLDALKTATLKRAGIDVSKWNIDIKYTTNYDEDLKDLSNIITQVAILLDVQKDPKDFEGRNLVKEIVDKLENSTNLNEYINAVTILDKYNEKYPDQKVAYDVEKTIKKILSNQQEDGGFTLIGNTSNSRTTGDVLLALSKHKDIEAVKESINKATNYLRSIQKEDGGLYETVYITGYHADIVRGLVAVGEDLRTEKWTKAGKNPVDALFILWKEDNSFDYKKGESKSEATQKALYALIDLKEAGYGDYYAKDVKISGEIEEPATNVNVYVRVEGNDRTIVPKTQVAVDKLDLSDYGITKKFENPRAIHAIIKALESKGIDCKDSEKGLNHGGGSNITMIDGLKVKSTGDKDGWMYYVDHQFAPVGVSNFEIKEGQSIVVFFVEDYNKNIYAWFDKEEMTVKTGKNLDIVLTGNYYDMDTDKIKTEPVQLAKILVNNQEYKIGEKSVCTNEDGKATLKFDKAGTYYVSAERFDQETNKRDLTRPYCKVVVEKDEVDQQKPVITTDLENKVVNKEKLIFTVSATDGKIEVKVNGKVIEGKEKKYTVTLIEGKNTIIITTVDKTGNKAEETYTITYEKNKPSNGNVSGGGGGGGPAPARSGTKVEKDKDAKVEKYNAVIEIPKGAIDENTYVKIEKQDNVSNLKLSENEKIIGSVYEITKDKSKDFKKAITITLPFEKSKIDKDKEELSLCFYDESNKKWVELENVKVDFEKGKISGQVTHFTKFAVISMKIEKEVIKEPVNQEIKVDLKDTKGHWAEGFIKELVQKQAISGYPDQTFKPDQNITRAEFAAVVIKAFKLQHKEGKVFTDTKDHWAKGVISTASAHGIVSGYEDGSFRPDEKITREQMAVMVVKASKLIKQENTQVFADHKDISSWAKDAIDTVISKEIIKGYPDGTLKPQGNATRAEAVTVIVKAMK
ncbi:Ig-like domain-containing protein [Inediibacterium massiliense]|uniref:Ig-like domain-containing protein n=1 Tax=Inediibacterium massiliense TaxID=1658111 RepID=UPI0006B5C478|nr:Ig-like domain-containing protein [Inediibacterium massiliense]